jgi:8-oxo-dGTP pyrophosphatase MutT (NUDIX family)
MANRSKDLSEIAYLHLELGKISLARGQSEEARRQLRTTWKLASELDIEKSRSIASVIQDVYRKKFEAAKSQNAQLHISSGGVVYRGINEEPEIVLLHRIDSDTWHLPKGTVEKGESLRQTALREVHEETNLIGEIQGYLMNVYSEFCLLGEWIPKRTYYYLIQAQSRNLRCDDEHDEAFFVPLREAIRLVSRHNEFEYELPVVELATPFLTGSRKDHSI